MSKNIIETYIVVKGSGDFPFDMLRYDMCHPMRTEDAVNMAPCAGAGHWPEERAVILVHRGVQKIGKLPTLERWRSFGWVVACYGECQGTAVHVCAQLNTVPA